jgi:hypothetical protein
MRNPREHDERGSKGKWTWCGFVSSGLCGADRFLRSRLTLIVAAVILCTFSAATSNAAQKAARSPASRHKSKAIELAAIEQLKEAFRNDDGNVRLVVLVSPT